VRSIGAYNPLLGDNASLLIDAIRNRQLDAPAAGLPPTTENGEPSDGKIEDEPSLVVAVALVQVVNPQGAGPTVSRRPVRAGFEHLPKACNSPPARLNHRKAVTPAAIANGKEDPPCWLVPPTVLNREATYIQVELAPSVRVVLKLGDMHGD
jgi:hypothetical protein